MKVLITGAAGFIGSQLAHSLALDGDSLVLIDNFSYGSADNLIFDDMDFREDIMKADVRDREKIHEIIAKEKPDCIYHIAGIAPLPDCQTNPCEAIDVNVTGTVNILECARIEGVRKIVFASTNAMYENETEFPTREESFSLPTLIYPNTKYAAERFCESYCRTYGMNITCLRFANVYGPHIDCLRKQPPFVGYMIRELYYDRTPVFHSDGTQRRDYIYVSDLIALAKAVRASEGFEQLNVSSNKNYSVAELYAIASQIMGKDIKARYVSSDNYWTKYPSLSEGAYPIKTEILTHEVNKYSLCDNAAARKKYGWEPRVSIEEGLRCSIDYEVKMLSALGEKNERN